MRVAIHITVDLVTSIDVTDFELTNPQTALRAAVDQHVLGHLKQLETQGVDFVPACYTVFDDETEELITGDL